MARDAIAAASYVTRWCWAAIDNQIWCYGVPPPDPDRGFISAFPAIGPTRDGRPKPDIAAPGQGIASARSVDANFGDLSIINPDGIHAVVQGTSFAAPHVSGAVALLLAQDPTLDADQITVLLQNNALKDGFTGQQCNVTWGCGKLDISGLGVQGPRSLAGKPLAGFRATPSRRITVLYGMVVYVLRFTTPLLHRQSTLRKRRLGENRSSRPDF